jgi:hypothetical protein
MLQYFKGEFCPQPASRVRRLSVLWALGLLRRQKLPDEGESISASAGSEDLLMVVLMYIYIYLVVAKPPFFAFVFLLRKPLTTFCICHCEHQNHDISQRMLGV